MKQVEVANKAEFDQTFGEEGTAILEAAQSSLDASDADSGVIVSWGDEHVLLRLGDPENRDVLLTRDA